MTTAEHTPDPGLTGAARRVAYVAARAGDNAERRAAARLPTRHGLVIRELRVAQMLPAPGGPLNADERRGIRNKLKAMRRARGAGR